MSINRLVGERVFGWTVVAASDGEPIWSNECSTPLAFQYASAPVKFGPNFSTEIAAAWEIVEKLHGHHECAGYGYCVQLHKDPRGDRSFLDWKCRFMGWANPDATEGGEMPTAWAVADTAPMAICLAALRAVGVPEATIQEACK